jgi:predicted deacetylase
MKKRRKTIFKIFFVLISIILAIFLIRTINPTEIDDITPGISCPEIMEYNPDILYVIPNYNQTTLSENKNWCGYISYLNKDLRLHGITHTYREFLYEEISQEELDFGISEFEKCFGYAPESFKPPQLRISKENKKLIKENNLEILGFFNQLTHKVYHCDDSDIISNKIIKIF